MSAGLGFCFTILAAFSGGLLLSRFKLPAGAMIGSMIGVAILNITTGGVWLPSSTRIITQMLAGGFIGIGINREMLGSLRKLVKPAVILIISMLSAGICIGFVIYRFSSLDITTSLLASAPGGMSDMTLIGMDMGADVSKMVVLHLVRLVCVICICPQMIKAIAYKYDRVVFDSKAKTTPSPDIACTVSPKPSILTIIRKNSLTIAVAAVGGMLGRIIGIPAGVLLFAIAAVGAFSVATGKAYMSRNMRKTAQIVAGAMVGKDIGIKQVLELKTMILPAILLVIIYIISNLLIALLLNRTCGMGITNALFASMPAGASDMALIAGDISADAPQVALLQMARLISVIAVFPIIVPALIR